MATPNVGSGAGVIGLALETAYGTAAARTNWLEIDSCTVRRVRTGAVAHNMVASGSKDMAPRARAPISDLVQGSIAGKLAYDDSSIFLLYHALGKTTDTGATSPYTHTIETTTPDNWPLSFTLERAWGLRASTKDAEVFTGCRISKLALTWGVEGYVTWTADIVGHDSSGRTTLGAPSLHTSPTYVMAHHLGSLTWDSIAGAIRGGTLTIDRHLDMARVDGSLAGNKAYPAQALDVSLQVTRFYDEVTAYASQLADTNAALSLQFDTGGTETLQIDLASAEATAYDDPVSGPGLSEYSITFVGLGSASDAACVITATNGNALTTTN